MTWDRCGLLGTLLGELLGEALGWKIGFEIILCAGWGTGSDWSGWGDRVGMACCKSERREVW